MVAFSSLTTSSNRSTELVLGTSVVASFLAVQFFTSANPVGRSLRFFKQLAAHESRLTSADSVNRSIDDYSKLHANGTSTTERTANYQALVNAYYDLATVFYEWGWGSSFHFSYQFPFESFYESIRRHEYQLVSQLQVYGMTSAVLDVGCGIGGPMRNIAKFLQCRVTGITLNPYQVARANELNTQDVNIADNQCLAVQGDFMNLPFPEESFDGAYAIEATCHAPDRLACYKQVYNVIKPGASFVLYEWCMTDRYNAENPRHAQMKKDIEQGNGLPDIIQTKDCLQALSDAGFEILHESDLASTVPHTQPWQTPLTASWNPMSQRFQFNCIGGPLTNAVIQLLEWIRLAPSGTVKTQKVLQKGAFALREAANEGIFTTMYFLHGRKPV